MRGGNSDVPAMVTVPASASRNIMRGEDSMNDDVFEMENDASAAASTGLTPRPVGQPLTTTPSPTGYRDYKPPAEVLDENYGHRTMDYGNARSNLKRTKTEDSAMAHKTILLGDSGVGKTSLLVQFDTGKFQPGNFAATVGIGFTVSPKNTLRTASSSEPSAPLRESIRLSIQSVARLSPTFTRRPLIGRRRSGQSGRQKRRKVKRRPRCPSPSLVPG